MGRHRQLAAEVASTIDNFDQLITPDPPALTEPLLKARVILVQAVNTYIAHLGSCLAASPGHTQLPVWRQAHDYVVGLRRRYSEHIGRFSAATIISEWQTYRMSCKQLISAMRRHLGMVAGLVAID